MASLRETYRLWRRKTLPASKNDVKRVQNDIARVQDNLMRLQDSVNKLSKVMSPFQDKPQGDPWFAISALQMTNQGVSKPEFVSHTKWISYLSGIFNKPGLRVLEIGSRKVTGGVPRKSFAAANYVGFDFYEGENVDVVGDAHKISTYFNDDEKFDLIYSSAVFEHLYMPWIVAQEIKKLLKIGGYVFIETHFSFSYHEGPWNFFQFSDMGLRALFNSGMGFDLVDSGMSNPMNGVFSQEADEYLRGKPIGALYCHSEILCKKTRDVPDFEWSKVEIDEIVKNTRYPPPKRPASNTD